MFKSLLRKRNSQQKSLRPVMSEASRVLREQLTSALSTSQHEPAIAILARLEAMESRNPRWPHKRGDLLRQVGRSEQAFVAYATAVRLYTDTGLPDCARAMAKVALAIGNSHKILPTLDGVTRMMFQAAADREIGLGVIPASM